MDGFDNKDLQQRLYDLIDPFIMKFVRDVKGSVSAEHGIGQQKPKYLGYSKSPGMIKCMRKIKTALDPNNIMNPYKVLEMETPNRLNTQSL